MQNDFNKLLKLIENHKNEIILELLFHCKNNEITYSTLDKEKSYNNRLHLLEAYKQRWKFDIERDNQFVEGYKELILGLSKTKFNNICVSSITSEIGTYIIFTDDNKTEFIGILKSKRTLNEVREKYTKHKQLLEKLGERVIYDYESNETVFVIGILKQRKT